MGTRGKIRNSTGYCLVDKQVSIIGIQYISNPLTGNRFIKNRNRCYYLDDGRCILGNECSIFINAPVFIEVNPNDAVDEY